VLFLSCKPVLAIVVVVVVVAVVVVVVVFRFLTSPSSLPLLPSSLRSERFWTLVDFMSQSTVLRERTINTMGAALLEYLQQPRANFSSVICMVNAASKCRISYTSLLSFLLSWSEGQPIVSGFLSALSKLIADARSQDPSLSSVGYTCFNKSVRKEEVRSISRSLCEHIDELLPFLRNAFPDMCLPLLRSLVFASFEKGSLELESNVDVHDGVAAAQIFTYLFRHFSFRDDRYAPFVNLLDVLNDVIAKRFCLEDDVSAWITHWCQNSLLLVEYYDMRDPSRVFELQMVLSNLEYLLKESSGVPKCLIDALPYQWKNLLDLFNMALDEDMAKVFEVLLSLVSSLPVAAVWKNAGGLPIVSSLIEVQTTILLKLSVLSNTEANGEKTRMYTLYLNLMAGVLRDILTSATPLVISHAARLLVSATLMGSAVTNYIRMGRRHIPYSFAEMRNLVKNGLPPSDQVNVTGTSHGLDASSKLGALLITCCQFRHHPPPTGSMSQDDDISSSMAPESTGSSSLLDQLGSSLGAKKMKMSEETSSKQLRVVCNQKACLAFSCCCCCCFLFFFKCDVFIDLFRVSCVPLLHFVSYFAELTWILLLPSSFFQDSTVGWEPDFEYSSQKGPEMSPTSRSGKLALSTLHYLCVGLPPLGEAVSLAFVDSLESALTVPLAAYYDEQGDPIPEQVASSPVGSVFEELPILYDMFAVFSPALSGDVPKRLHVIRILHVYLLELIRFFKGSSTSVRMEKKKRMLTRSLVRLLCRLILAPVPVLNCHLVVRPVPASDLLLVLEALSTHILENVLKSTAAVGSSSAASSSSSSSTMMMGTANDDLSLRKRKEPFETINSFGRVLKGVFHRNSNALGMHYFSLFKG